MPIAARFPLCVVACVLAWSVAPVPAEGAIPFKTIASPGPLPSIAVGNEGSCQVAHVGDQQLELFPSQTTPGDCGTFIFSGGVLYGPNFPGHDQTAATSGLGALTPFTPQAQSEVAGSGVAADPLRVTTTYVAGATGLRVTQIDSYVPGQEAFRTDVQIQNAAATAQAGVIYRAGDCYLQESDVGYGFVETATNGPGCSINANNAPAGRIEQWVPLTAASTYLEDRFSSVWSAIGAHAPFPNSCQCATSLDNGAGLSWSFNVAPGATATFSHLTVFSPTGVTGGQLPPTPTAPSIPTAPPVAASLPPGVLALPLPSNRRCVSRRAFPIRVRRYPGVEWAFAYVAVNGRTVPVYVYSERRVRVTRIGAVYLNARRFRALVDLRGLPKRTYRVRVSAVTTDGQLRANTRQYRTCAGKLRGSIPRL
ncbi:hypothetical protein FSW04_14065 [Baekduia soli]|uniref:DUF4232 domain-containing protein n=1 Tax=Baekduia soli TaxID=496014 RepID=A0A5B8U6Q5_9ACTN|nr:hypothetical protein [Baekduia soli]QEC48585.1 hypothetical protein FSW04_14065 [Baekduia soli]